MLKLEWIITSAGLICTVALCILANWRAGLPWDDMRPRRIPWRIVLIFSGFAFVLFLVHAVNLLGVETGAENNPFGRF